VAILCVLTQVLNPILAMQENDSSEPFAKLFVHEHNKWFFIRISLTTLAIVVFSSYLLATVWSIVKRLQRNIHLHYVKNRVICLAALIEFVMLLRVVLIWS